MTGDYALVLLDLLCPATPASTCLERSARMPEPASDRADRARSRRAERGLDRGANDWVTKPFSLEELWASVRAYLRSPGQRESSVIEAGTSGWICALRRVERDGHEVQLTAGEFEVPANLMRDPDQVLSRELAVRGFDSTRGPRFGGE